MRRAIVLVGALTAAVLVAGNALSQPAERIPPPPPPAEHAAGSLMDELRNMNEDDARSLIETVRMVRLSQELGLNDEQTVVLVRQYNETKETAARLQKERQEIARELRERLNSGAPEDEIERNLDQLIAKDKETQNLRFDAFQQVSKNLTPAQTAKLYLFMGDFEKRMRGLIEKAREQYREHGPEGMRDMIMREGGPRRGFGGRGEGPGGRGGWRGGAEQDSQETGDAPAPERTEQE